MKLNLDPKQNYQDSSDSIGYVKRKDAKQGDYDRIGFMSGLEVHQQIFTEKKLFCQCPAGQFHKHDDFDAELVRHMRPTLSELGEYDGTALMEFRTKKEIVYRIKHETTCTYEVDDTPPFPMNREALENSLEISLLSKLNIVGEVHITRKQYLDGSIPAGFQRTAIIGVEGEIELKNKKVRLIQLSIEEDSCREISDIGHIRTYKTDRLGMPLIETVTYPDFVNPDEVKEGCDYIRFLNRSTGKVRTGIGAGRQDVNVSCRGGSRVEIKGVAHTKWIPELSHNEAYRQWALLNIKDLLNKNITDTANWKTEHILLDENHFKGNNIVESHFNNNRKIVAVKLPHFYKILSHFVQPGKVFANEISERLKVIACLNQPNMTHSEDLNPILKENEVINIFKKLNANKDDAFVLFFAPEEDIKTAIETIEERCQMALVGVPEETRKSFGNGTTIFERVLPGADRMYPDTDSAPIPLSEEYIETIRKRIPSDIIDRYHQLKKWDIAKDTYTYIFSKNLYPLLEKIIKELNIPAKYIGTFLGHNLKYIEGHYKSMDKFNYNLIFDLFKYISDNGLRLQIAEPMILELYQHPKMDFDSILQTIKFKKISEDEIIAQISFLREKFKAVARKQGKEYEHKWIMGQLHYLAKGNIDLSKLSANIKEN
ncbi:MAG: Glu-tRNA(Gln) amidotransferase GatDE subunit E [Bacteroidetes bacterium]|nr:MAG: Glu-tRNA(Gln) amidotransferase GatDE subunit E [Bacteroidota bacterium]